MQREKPVLRVGRKTVWAGAVLVATFNAAMFASVAVDKAYIRRVAHKIIAPGSRDTDIVKAVTAFVHDDVYHLTRQEVDQFSWYLRVNYLYSRLRPGPRSILEHGEHLAPCQSNSRVFKELLAAHGINSRLVIQHDDNLIGIHSVMEVDYAGTKGIVGPSFGIIYQHPDGRPATLKELRDDRELFVWNARRGFAYGWGPNSKAVKMALPLDDYDFDNAYYFNYRWFGPIRWPIVKFSLRLFGADGPYYFARPGWYTYPAYTCAFALDALLVAGLLVLLSGRRIVRRFRQRRLSESTAAHVKGSRTSHPVNFTTR